MPLPKYDTEKVIVDIAKIIVAKFNAKLLEITADKANDSEVPQFDLKPLQENAIDLLSANRKNASYDPFLVIELLTVQPIQNIGQKSIEVALAISMLDPMDGTAEFRMLRYLRAFDEIFSPEEGVNIGLASLSATEILPYLDSPDFQDATKRRLTWGLRLRITL